MDSYLMLVLTEPVSGRDEEYNQWYDERHLDELCSVEGVVSAQRYSLVPSSDWPPAGQRWMALYELNTDDVFATLEKIRGAGRDGRVTVSDALDSTRATVQFWKFHGDRHVPHGVAE